MQVAITGPNDGRLPLDLEKNTHQACNNFAKQLGINRLKINIHLRMHMKVFMGNDFTEGLCEAIDKRHFVIDVCLWGNWLSNLAHEMVHVKQFARGELSLDMDRWKSKKYCGNIEYWSQPWEIEARKLQNKMVEIREAGEW